MTTDTLDCHFRPALFSRVHGAAGPTVLCLHSSTGSQGQWRGLAAALAELARVITPDLHGHGRSPAWPVGQTPSLHIDARAAAHLLPAEGGVHLVAHSYGAAVALQMALDQPERVLSLTLYEPVAFGVLLAMAPKSAALTEISTIAQQVARLSAQGRLAEAADVFVCYWGGAGAWSRMNDTQRESVAGRIATIPLHFEALFGAAWAPGRLGALRMPLLLMHGSQTRASARQVAELLGTALPHARRLEVSGAGHLGPMTHEAVVNEAIIGHLEACGALSPAAAEPALS